MEWKNGKGNLSINSTGSVELRRKNTNKYQPKHKKYVEPSQQKDNNKTRAN